jgi:hypothetical protein
MAYPYNTYKINFIIVLVNAKLKKKLYFAMTMLVQRVALKGT